MDVGARLKAVRKMHGLSQRELAKRAGVTNSTISMIEKNSVSPSVSSLKKTLSGIPMSLVEFFSTDIDVIAKEPVIYRAEELLEMNAGDISMKIIGKNRSNRAMSFMDEVYPVGSDTGEEMLSHEGEEAGMVVAGVLELTVGHEVYHLSPGDSYYFESSRPHRFRNTGEEDCRLISCTTPANF
ncbi:cupin domain-containing protein [Parendozoicomonas haliclonae]|uniref:HTH-type transcriptional regulator PuuR n=1 Tax=Parendozoicomonas haliclonae TaxID=1960125 RepID=A0A1X7ARE1_9GAMM|nr:cupin domain-containing protein [Parendozoicomonas haliclonae]SMA50805.1 HTH-type transcriptional regulator PuuR [Parendozoicomonas haliclonae]